jgi:predicted enzyme related to lactoylglutathione lyase
MAATKPFPAKKGKPKTQVSSRILDHLRACCLEIDRRSTAFSCAHSGALIIEKEPHHILPTRKTAMDAPNFSLALLKIPVSDITASAKFYSSGLGFEQECVFEEYGWAQFKAGDLSIALYIPGMGGGNRAPGGSVDFHIAASDLELLRDRLREYDPHLKLGIFKNDDGSETLEFSDPDGNEMKIMKSSG